MKQYNVSVLAKGQVVIPKELRDDMGILVGDTLNCFMRGSALVLKKKIQTISYGVPASGDQFPLGVESDGKTLTVAIQELKGITCLLGKTGNGKAVHALNIMVNMYTSGKSLIVFDPYGDLISEIKNHIADLGEESIYHYGVGESTDWPALKNAFLQDKKQKILTISTNFQGIGSKKSAELSKPIILECYKELVDNETAVFIDEFGTYFDEQLLGTIGLSPAYTCILDQSRDGFSRDQVSRLFASINHIAIYQVSGLTAKYLVEDLGLSHTVQDLRSIEKYHFYFHSTLGNKNVGQLLLGIYPLN